MSPRPPGGGALLAPSPERSALAASRVGSSSSLVGDAYPTNGHVRARPPGRARAVCERVHERHAHYASRRAAGATHWRRSTRAYTDGEPSVGRNVIAVTQHDLGAWWAPALAFAAGTVSFASPCVFPLVPGYLSFLTAERAVQESVHESVQESVQEDETARGRRQV